MILSVFCSSSVQVPLPHDVRALDIYRAAREAPADEAIRFFGCFTDGGCDEAMQKYWVSRTVCSSSPSRMAPA
jgi:hypothetical protein